MYENEQNAIQNRFDSILQKVVKKNKKVIFLSRRKDFGRYNNKTKVKKKKKVLTKMENYFGNFDID